MVNRTLNANVESMEARDVEGLSDEWLMDTYLEGNEASFSLLIQRYERELYSYLRRMIGDAGLAEDAFQNTFLTLHVKRRHYERGRPVRPWLYTIATHQAIDLLRKNQRHQRPSLDSETNSGREDGVGALMNVLSGSDHDPPVVAEDNERRSMVRRALGSLSETLRTVIVLSYYQGMKYKDIAEILDIPVGTVKSRLHAAVQRLGETWNKLGFSKDV